MSWQADRVFICVERRPTSQGGFAVHIAACAWDEDSAATSKEVYDSYILSTPFYEAKTIDEAANEVEKEVIRFLAKD